MKLGGSNGLFIAPAADAADDAASAAAIAFAVLPMSLYGADDCNLVLVVTGGKLGATFDTFSVGSRP